VTASGILVSTFGWRAIFLVNLPPALLALAVSVRVLPAGRSQSRTVNPVAAILLTTAVTSLATAIIATRPHTSPPVVAIAAVAVTGLSALGFVRRERTAASPLVPRSFFAHPTRLGANLISIPVVGSMASMFCLLSIGQGALEHATPLTIGLRYLPFCLAFFVGIGASVPLQRVVPPRTVIAAGMRVVTTGMFWLAHTVLTEPFRTGLLPASLALAIGYGLIFPPLQFSATADLTDNDTGLGSGVQATAQAIGNAVLVPRQATLGR
jgi:hypothetical protein